MKNMNKRVKVAMSANSISGIETFKPSHQLSFHRRVE
jgi:hypothetical protein